MLHGWGRGRHLRWGPTRCRPGGSAGLAVGPPLRAESRGRTWSGPARPFQVRLAAPVPASGSPSPTTTPRPTRSSAPGSGTTSRARWRSRCLPGPVPPGLGGRVSHGGHTGTCSLSGPRARPVPPHQGHGPLPAALERPAVPVQRTLVPLRPDGVLAHVPPLRAPRGPPSGECERACASAVARPRHVTSVSPAVTRLGAQDLPVGDATS